MAEDEVAAEAEDDEPEESVPQARASMIELLGLTDEPTKRNWGRLRRSVRLAIVLVWRAAGWRAAGVALLQMAVGLGLGAQLLVGNSLLTQALSLRQAGGDVSSLLPRAVWVGVITAALALLQGVSSSQQRILSELVSNTAYGEIMAAAAAAELVEFEDSSFYDRLQRAAVGGQFRPFQVVSALLQLSSSVVGSIGIGAALFTIKPVLVPLALVAVIPIWWATTRNARGQYFVALNNTADDRERRYLRNLLTERDAAKEVRAFNLLGYLRERHDRLSVRILDRIAKESWRNMRTGLVGQAGGGLAAIIGGSAILWLLVTNRVGVAAAITAALAMQQLRSRVVGSAHSFGQIFESGFYLEDYRDFVSISTRPRREGRSPEGPFRRLAADAVSFNYPGSDVPSLKHVDVEIAAGEVVALVGENGSGKTTLAKVLSGLYEPTDGRVVWDGVDTRELDARAMREHMTVIFQDFVHYALPARDNIGLGRHERLDDSDAMAAAIEVAGIGGVIDQLPQGLDTVLGREFTGGQDLSGGQWQRVALARAFFRDAPFLVLDEPTAALDARAEHRLFTRLRELAAGRSVLLITHRFGNVRMADRIYVLHRGEVVEHGRHQELMALGGRYAELFSLQAAQFLDDQRTSDAVKRAGGESADPDELLDSR